MLLCACVDLSVFPICICDYSKANELIFMIYFTCVVPDKRKKCLNLGKDLGHTPDTEKS